MARYLVQLQSPNQTRIINRVYSFNDDAVAEHQAMVIASTEGKALLDVYKLEEGLMERQRRLVIEMAHKL